MATADTRARVREIADKLVAAGQVPTSTTVRKLLGRGSYETITDELRAWQAARGFKPGNPAVEAAERLGAQHATELIAEASGLAKELAAAVAAARESAAVMSRLPAELAALKAEMAALNSSFEIDRAAMREEVSKANERYAGVQKYAMNAIEAARAEARLLGEQLAASSDKTGARESAYRQQCEDLRVVIHQLQGRLAEQGKRFDDVAVPPRVEFGDKAAVRLSSAVVAQRAA